MVANRKVAIKSYRPCFPCPDYLPAYMVSSAFLWYVTPTKSQQRFYAEALGCNRLQGPHIVPFIGVYSIYEHPMALVFKFRVAETSEGIWGTPMVPGTEVPLICHFINWFR